jgi:hypothetical protein
MKLPRSFKLPTPILKNQGWIKYENKSGISYNYRIKEYIASWGLEVVIAVIFSMLVYLSGSYLHAGGSSGNYGGQNKPAPAVLSTNFTLQNPAATFGNTNGDNSSFVANLAFTHLNIITTEFWAGEEADSSNGNISNSPSAWDEQWKTHFGGTDSPNSRNGYLPAGFSPKENPFYFALPYNDFDDSGKRKATAGSCANGHNPSLANYSWCKNAWIVIRHNGKAVYAQWEDVGPFEEDDFAYVFGGSTPKNKQGEKAGLDVSPAISDYLGLSGSDKCDWSFVSFGNVPDGPWKQIVTSSRGDSL